MPGLDLVHRVTGLPAVVIPHFDNAEGGHHDTRFCYLGERRLARLERELPPEAFVLGVDEHTGVLLDLAARTATVVGNGLLTVRQAGDDPHLPGRQRRAVRRAGDVRRGGSGAGVRRPGRRRRRSRRAAARP